MKTQSNVLFLGALSLFLLLSCDLREAPEKAFLNYENLSEKLAAIPSYNAYIAAIRKEDQEMYTRVKNLSKGERDFLNVVHRRFSSPAEILNHADKPLLKKYQQISGVDLKNGNTEQEHLHENFINLLRTEFSFNYMDVNSIIVSDIRSQRLYKTSCEEFCEDAAEEKQEEVLAVCQENDGENCTRRANIARRYYKMGCLEGCHYE